MPVDVWKNIFSCPGTVYLGTVRAVWWLGKESRVCQKVGAESSFFLFYLEGEYGAGRREPLMRWLLVLSLSGWYLGLFWGSEDCILFTLQDSQKAK